MGGRVKYHNVESDDAMKYIMWISHPMLRHNWSYHAVSYPEVKDIMGEKKDV